MFAAAAQLASQAVMKVYGQTVTVVVGAVSSELTAVYTAPNTGSQNPTRSPFQRPDHQLLFHTEELAATGAKAGHQVLIGSRRFYIADIEDDDGAMTTVTIRPQ